MNPEGIITLFFVFIAIAWGIWLIFKQDLLKNAQLIKILSYFLGVIVTLIIILWITSRFLPWWAVNLVENTQNSEDIDRLKDVSQDLWAEAVSRPPEQTVVISTPVTNPPPGPQPTISPVNPPESQAAGGERVHTVVRGDTLYSLARRYGVSMDAIRQRNNITGDNIRAGDTLIIP